MQVPEISCLGSALGRHGQNGAFCETVATAGKPPELGLLFVLSPWLKVFVRQSYVSRRNDKETSRMTRKPIGFLGLGSF